MDKHFQSLGGQTWVNQMKIPFDAVPYLDR